MLKVVVFGCVLSGLCALGGWGHSADRPNILVAISDDQSWPHASAYGSRMVVTPHFDRVAREGMLFHNAICASPGCSPSRAALLTGRNTWQVEHAGTHASYFDPKYVTYPDRLAAAGYAIGSTGKGWGPGDFRKLGRPHNPAGPQFRSPDGRSGPGNYAGAFAAFLKQRPAGAPFCFWFGSPDPHRAFEKGSGLASGKRLEQAEVPGFLPDTPEIRGDLLDYAVEVERFDADLGELIALLERSGELQRTLIIVTSDNGMAFPRAKANCYEFGVHVPLAMCWPDRIPAGREHAGPVGFTDITATIYEAAGVAPPVAYAVAGRSLLPLLTEESPGLGGPGRSGVFAARERHSSSRYESLGYPQRCLRTAQHLLVRNLRPERWPAGAARTFEKVVYSESGTVAEARLGAEHGGYHDIDACPTLAYMVKHRSDPAIGRFLDLAVERRPSLELYDIRSDPACLKNLAGDPGHAAVLEELDRQLTAYLVQTGDARANGAGDVWETYPRVSNLRWFPEPDWARETPASVPQVPWLEARRPRAVNAGK